MPIKQKIDDTIIAAGKLLKPKDPGLEQAQADCINQGGQWDSQTNQCILPQPKKEETQSQTTEKPIAVPGQPEVFKDSQTGELSGITIGGKDFLGLNPEEVNEISQRQIAKTQLPEGTAMAGTAQNQLDTAFEAQILQGQVGQFQQQQVSPTGLDFNQAARQGVIGAIPSALKLATIGAGVGLAAGTPAAPLTGGISIPAGIGIGAVGGFVAGIAGNLISNFKSQRTDTISAQKKVLTEGKQTMKDWATLAEADPANKAKYLAQYNQVSAQIDQAYRQMKLDTSRDVAKFETALPDLAEFEAFYSEGGERDTLDIEMRSALLAPTTVDYKMLELAERRK